MDYSYYELITEVRTTNNLLEEQNQNVINLGNFIVVICLILIVIMLRDVF